MIGSALRIQSKRGEPLLRRLENLSVPVTESGCWIWIGKADHNGYGLFNITSTGNPVMAHRLCYELTKGEIPKGLHLLHSCDTPPCINPAHLKPGTQKKNMQECVDRGRHDNGRTFAEFCKNGHPLSGENLRIEVTGFRRCQTCRKAYAVQSRLRKRNESAR